MAVNNYTTTLREWENIIRVNLKVTNPTLLKSGALGILSNYLASIKFDVLQFYSKTFQEINPGLAQDFNSMLYHASIYGAEIQFATASTLSATLIVPEITLSHVNTLVYDIPLNTKFIDTNDIPFMTTAEIKIEQSQMSITATSWDAVNGVKKLSITKAPNPNIPGRYVYLIHSGDFQQFKKIFNSTIITSEPTVGVSTEFEVGIEALNEVKQVRAWINTGPAMSLVELESVNTTTMASVNPNVEELNVKFYKFESSIRDEDLFVEMYPYSLNFETGDGIHGALPEFGSQIITEIQTTRGSSGNVPNSEFLVGGVNVTERWGNNSLKYYQTTLNGMSIAGSIGGQSIESIESIRDDIFTRISVRNSVITENDYEAMFQYQGVRPFVDAKFIDAQAFVFLFNVIRNNDIVVPSTAVNVKEDWLLKPDANGDGGPFYPTLVYAGQRLTSPFYYKTLDNNRVDAYMVNPQMNIALRGDVRTPDVITLKELKVEMAVTYDFVTNSSYLEILSGGQEEYDYYFVCDQFQVTITAFNNDHVQPYTYKIEQLFTDAFCVLNEPLTNILLHVRDKQGRVQASYISDGTYSQILKKQTFYKYFQEVEEPVTTTAASSDTMAYLDNIQSNAMSTMTDIRSQTMALNEELVNNRKPEVDKYILRMPFISSSYFFSKTPLEMFEIFNAYFIMNLTEEFLNYNTLATQSFHNTIDIPPMYYNSLFKRNTMDYLSTPKIPIDIEIHGDRTAMMTSKFDNTSELETSIRIEVIKFLKQKEGFTIEFFETDLEKYIYDTFSPLLKNVTVLSPTLFQVNSSAEVYNSLEENLDFVDVLNFVPPFFHYDYAGMQLSVTW